MTKEDVLVMFGPPEKKINQSADSDMKLTEWIYSDDQRRNHANRDARYYFKGDLLVYPGGGGIMHND
jgi:hypothetical protein